MSASEKLKALDEAIPPGRITGLVAQVWGITTDRVAARSIGPELDTLRNALPQIWAVVKAAEQECAPKERSDPAKSGVAFWAAQVDHPVPGVQRRIVMARAIAALEKALS